MFIFRYSDARFPRVLGRLHLCLLIMLMCMSCRTNDRTLQENRERGAEPDRPYVILVSIDGYRDDYLSRGLSPTLESLAKIGVRGSLRPSFPTLSLPNHYALVTGLVPNNNGIVSNAMWDSQLGRFTTGKHRQALNDGRWWSQARPIWEIAYSNRLRSATVLWPGSGAEIHGIRPDYWIPYSAQITSNQRVQIALDWLDRPESERPHLTALYLEEVDRAGHTFGPDSPELNHALESVDFSLKLLINGLQERELLGETNIVIVSDHGMAASPPENLILIDNLIPADQVNFTSLGALAGIDPNPNYPVDDLLTILNNAGKPMRCWRKESTPGRFLYGSNPRVPKVLCLADIGWRISTNAISRKIEGKFGRGEHGYDNALAEMQAIMVACGPSFRKNVRLGSYSNVDVFMLLTSLLRLPEQPSDADSELSRSALLNAEE